MQEIKIFASIHTKLGHFIAKENYDFINTEVGKPAMQTGWPIPKLMGAYNAAEMRVFVFAKDAIRIAQDDDHITTTF